MVGRGLSEMHKETLEGGYRLKSAIRGVKHLYGRCNDGITNAERFAIVSIHEKKIKKNPVSQIEISISNQRSLKLLQCFSQTRFKKVLALQ